MNQLLPIYLVIIGLYGRQVEYLALFDNEYLSVKFSRKICLNKKTSPPTCELEGFNIDGDLGCDLNK